MPRCPGARLYATIQFRKAIATVLSMVKYRDATQLTVGRGEYMKFQIGSGVTRDLAT
jgi:hypothetical protein